MRTKKTARGKTFLVQTRYGEHLFEFVADPDGKGYTAVAKHLPGVVTQGKTIHEAKKMAREAAELCIECLVEEKRTLAPAGRRMARRLPETIHAA